MAAFARTREFVGTVLAEIKEKNVTFMAGSIAYYAFVSLLPLLLLLILVASLADMQEVARNVVDAVTSFAPAAGGLLEGAIEGAAQGGSVGVIGAVVLVWGALKIFRGLDTAFSEIYETDREESLPGQVGDGLLVLVSLGLALVATVVAGVVVEVVPLGPLARYAPTVLLVFGLALAFFPMFYVFPDADVTARGVLPGVVLAAVGWTVLQSLFRVYVGVAGQSAAYGVLGGVLLLVTFLYFAGLVLLVAAVVNAVADGHAGQRAAGQVLEIQSEVANARTLSTDETADYLSSLRERMTGRYERMAETDLGDHGETEPADLPLPDERVDEVEVAESDLENGDRHEVRLRWRDG